MIKQNIFNSIKEAILSAINENKLGACTEENLNNLSVDKTKNPEFGDYSVNISSLARFAKKAPPQIAETVLPYVKIEDAEISSIAGFINVKLGNSWLNSSVKEILDEKEKYAKNNIGDGEKVLIEYVSANPTGPLHIGHGRWAAVGSSLANIMKFSGYKVEQEFYINDCGNQIKNLGKSLWIRVLQELGEDVSIPTEGDEAKGYYPGEYLINTANKYVQSNMDKAKSLFENNSDAYNPSEEIISEMSNFAKSEMLKEQKELLSKFKTDFEYWYSESSLHSDGKVEKTLADLANNNELYEQDGALWFKSSNYGDDQDRVIKKADGNNTYLTADIAYHYEKLKRGYDKLINIWGADHHGYIPRMKASIEALGNDSSKLEVLLGQLVNLVIDGSQQRMGKRKKMYTLADLIDEVGVDSTRFWMIMRSIDTTLDFDVDLAKSKSDENPVFYVQYAHARACSILRNATSERLDKETKEVHPAYISEVELEDVIQKADLNLLNTLWTEDDKANKATKSLVLKLENFKEVVLSSAKLRAPYLIAKYAQELASDFHHFYAFSRVLNEDENIMKARLSLVAATKQVLVNSLSLLSVSAPNSM